MTALPTALDLEMLERGAMADLIAGLPAAARDDLALHLDDLPCGALFTLGRFPAVLDFNRTLHFGLTRPVTDSELDDLLALARRRGLERVMVGVVPNTPSAALREPLRRRGALPARGWAQLWRDAAPSPAPSPGAPEIRSVEPGQEDLFADVMARCFGLPPALRPMARIPAERPGWTHYLAWQGGQAVGCASVFVRGPLAWLGNGATVPDFRRRGVQAALIARRIADAAQAGARYVCTQVAEELPDKPNSSEHNLRRAGFHTAYVREHLVVPTVSPGT